jgi:hypothetical protein
MRHIAWKTSKGGVGGGGGEEVVEEEEEEEVVEEEEARPDAGASPGRKTCRRCLRLLACAPSSAITRSRSTLSSLPTMSARQWGRYLGGAT